MPDERLDAVLIAGAGGPRGAAAARDGDARHDRAGRLRRVLPVAALRRDAAAREPRARAINPSILLADEPFSALDAQTRERLQRDLATLVARLGTTVLFITHDIREALSLADRVVVLSARPGRILSTVDVPQPRPRPAEFLLSVELATMASGIWKLLQS